MTCKIKWTCHLYKMVNMAAWLYFPFSNPTKWQWFLLTLKLADCGWFWFIVPVTLLSIYHCWLRCWDGNHWCYILGEWHQWMSICVCYSLLSLVLEPSVYHTLLAPKPERAELQRHRTMLCFLVTTHLLSHTDCSCTRDVSPWHTERCSVSLFPLTYYVTLLAPVPGMGY